MQAGGQSRRKTGPTGRGQMYAISLGPVDSPARQRSARPCPAPLTHNTTWTSSSHLAARAAAPKIIPILWRRIGRGVADMRAGMGAPTCGASQQRQQQQAPKGARGARAGSHVGDARHRAPRAAACRAARALAAAVALACARGSPPCSTLLPSCELLAGLEGACTAAHSAKPDRCLADGEASTARARPGADCSQGGCFEGWRHCGAGLGLSSACKGKMDGLKRDGRRGALDCTGSDYLMYGYRSLLSFCGDISPSAASSCNYTA